MVDNNEYLYYISARKFWGNDAQLLRVPLDSVSDAKTVHLPIKYGAYSLIRLINISKNRLALILRASKSRIFLSFSDDGLLFESPILVGFGTMPAVAEFSDGTLLVSYQGGPSTSQMRGKIKISINKKLDWSKAIELPHDGNIHGLFPSKRPDGNIDIYYSVADLNSRLALYRICINSKLEFGRSQKLLENHDLNIAKSAVFYTEKGRVLSFSNQSNDLTSSNLTLYPLINDAPDCPL